MKEYKGDIKGFPKEVVEKMLDEQERQGDKRDVSVFEKSRYHGQFTRGFDWADSSEGYYFWYNVIVKEGFVVFFEKYPKIESSEKTNKHQRITKHQQVKNHLMKQGHITSWEAIELYGATRLSAIIFTLKDRGFNIESIHKSRKDRNGNVSNYVKYTYKEKINNKKI